MPMQPAKLWKLLLALVAWFALCALALLAFWSVLLWGRP